MKIANDITQDSTRIIGLSQPEPLRWAEGATPARVEVRVGASVAAFWLDRPLAAGGHGVVYLARDQAAGRVVVIKVLHQALSRNPRSVERFLRESVAINALRHPSIVEILDVGALPDGRPFYAMEHLEGETLRDLIRRRGRLSAEESLDLFTPVCSALSAAHALGIIHRDVKPSNVFITSGEPRQVKLLDFGVAKLLERSEVDSFFQTTAGQVIGTPSIMAPEQIRCEQVDERTDIYALGALLFALLTGTMPFDAHGELSLLEQHLFSAPPRPSQRAPVSPELDAVVLRCLEKMPERRFASVEQLLEALRGAVMSRGAGHAAAAEVHTDAVGILVKISVDAEVLDDALAEDVGRVLDLVEGCFRANGFALLIAEDQVLAARPLQDDLRRARRTVKDAVALAASLLAELHARPRPDPRLDIKVCAHVDRVILCGGAEPELTGGALVEMDQWATASALGALWATPEAFTALGVAAALGGPGRVRPWPR